MVLRVDPGAVLGSRVAGGSNGGASVRTLAAWLGSSALALVLTVSRAEAIDATWLSAPGSGSYETGSNWSGGSRPDGTASFGTSSVTSLTILSIQSVGGWTFNSGASNYVVSIDGENALQFLGNGIVVNGGSIELDVHASYLRFANSSSAGTATININDATLSFTGSATAGNAVISSNREIDFNNTSTAGSASISNTGTIYFNDSSTAGSATIANSGSGTIYFYDGSSGGTARFINNAYIDLSNSAAFSVTMGSIQGSGTIYLGATNLQVGGNNFSTVYSGVLQDGGSGEGSGGSLTKVGTGTLSLTGTSTYTGDTLVAGGVLDVEGALNGTSSVTVQSGAVLMGAGNIATSTVSIDGTLAPGNGSAGTVLTINGSLAFASGAFYLVQVNPSVAASTIVSGTADLGGATVKAVFAPGSYVSKTYTILNAAGGVSGTFVSTILEAGLPSNVHSSLSYDANNVYLNLALDFAIAPNLNINQRNVGDGLTNSFDRNAGIPGVYAALSAGGLTIASGELATRVQQTTFEAMSQFTGLLTDRDMADCVVPEMRGKRQPCPETARWTVWASGFGGAQESNGNAGLGSHDATSRVFGTAVGADYRLSTDTRAGFALAGGGTNFGVNGLGSGRSDLFQAGAYLRHVDGPSYISAALAYGWQDVTTDRTVAISGADRLRAEFNANALSGRIEGGYRFVARWMDANIALTPYAAGQFTTVALPAYAESVLSGSNAFALAYAAKSVTDPRTELGIRADKTFAATDGILVLRGRLAWAHDFNPDRTMAAIFQALPDASFVVNGAAQGADSALLTASVEKTWPSGWSAAATFDGQFSTVTRSYAGRGVVRYAW